MHENHSLELILHLFLLVIHIRLFNDTIKCVVDPSEFNTFVDLLQQTDKFVSDHIVDSQR